MQIGIKISKPHLLIIFCEVFFEPIMYEAMAHEKDEPKHTHYIIVPYLATLLGGLTSNIFFLRKMSLAKLKMPSRRSAFPAHFISDPLEFTTSVVRFSYFRLSRSQSAKADRPSTAYRWTPTQE
jgi:hypothetical protein